MYVWRNIPEPPVRSLITAAGAKVKMPIQDTLCWDVAPPCTPESVNTLRQANFLGHVMYSHFGPNTEPAVDVRAEVAPDGSAFHVALSPKTWGAESITYDGKQHWVRWLQAETEFIVGNNSQRPQQVVISLHLATFRRPRRAHLLVNGTPVPQTYNITHDFWTSGPETVQYLATLQPGKSQLLLKSDEPMDMLPGNRPVSFLVLDDIGVAARP